MYITHHIGNTNKWASSELFRSLCQVDIHRLLLQNCYTCTQSHIYSHPHSHLSMFLFSVFCLQHSFKPLKKETRRRKEEKKKERKKKETPYITVKSDTQSLIKILSNAIRDRRISSFIRICWILSNIWLLLTLSLATCLLVVHTTTLSPFYTTVSDVCFYTQFVCYASSLFCDTGKKRRTKNKRKLKFNWKIPIIIWLCLSISIENNICSFIATVWIEFIVLVVCDSIKNWKK